VAEPDLEAVPTWADEYLDRVSDRLLHNYDLEKDVVVAGEPFDLAGEMRIESEKHFFHSSLNYANHQAREFLYSRRQEAISVSELESLVSTGHDIASDRVEHSDQHFSTDVTFAIVVPTYDDAVAEFVQSFADRTLLRFGFHGHYEINLIVVAPEDRQLAHSRNVDVWKAFQTWEPIAAEEPNVWEKVRRYFTG
jgi:hypothetical protein